MNPRLIQRIVQHLLTERTLLYRTIDDFDGDEDQVIQEQAAVTECEQLLVDIQKEQHGTEPNQEPKDTSGVAGGDGQ